MSSVIKKMWFLNRSTTNRMLAGHFLVPFSVLYFITSLYLASPYNLYQNLGTYIHLYIATFLCTVVFILQFHLRTPKKDQLIKTLSHLFFALLVFISVAFFPAIEIAWSQNFKITVTLITVGIGFAQLLLNRHAENHKYGMPDLKNFLWVFLLGILLLSFWLRIANLGELEPYADEYPHITHALAKLETGESTIKVTGELQDYDRAPILTQLVYYSFLIFGPSVTSARIPSALAGVLLTFLIYLFASKISRLGALVSALLFSIYPWMIAVDRTVREYSIFPIFYILFSIYLAYLSDRIASGLINKNLNSKDFLFCLPLAIPPLYVFFDYSSTFKQIVLLYAVFFVLLGIRLAFTYRTFFSQKLLAYSAGLFGLFFLVGYLLKSNALNTSFISNELTFSSYWIELFFLNFPSQFFFDANAYVAYLAFGLGIGYLLTAKNGASRATFIILSFFIITLFFSFLFDRYEQKRYISFNGVWFSMIVGFGYIALLKVTAQISARNRYHRLAIALISITLISSSVNITHVLTAANLTDGPKALVTNEYHDRYSIVRDEVTSLIKKDDVIVCGLCLPLIWNRQVDFTDNHLYKYTYNDPNRVRDLQNLLTQNEDGWVIIDSRRGGKWENGYSVFTNDIVTLPNGEVRKFDVLRDDEWRILRWTTAGSEL